MADIINLKNVRKRKARAERDTLADSNRLKFGRSKSDRALREGEKSLEAQRLDGHKRED